jgi:hypothetical protein
VKTKYSSWILIGFVLIVLANTLSIYSNSRISGDLENLEQRLRSLKPSLFRQIKEMIRDNGLAISIDEHRPQSKTKAERIMAILEPRYDMGNIWHYKGGECQTLEEELATQ